MKKTKILFLTLAITTLGMVTLSGCSKNAAHAAKQIPSASPTTDTTVSAQAYENGEELSADEQMQEENIRREEVAKQYSIYEPYGMTYDKKTDRFFYEGKMVRYFKDTVSDEHLNSFFFDDGVIDVEPIRDTNGTLTGLKQSSDTDFAARTEKENELKVEFEKTGIVNEGTSIELGDPTYRDESLEEYVAFGVSYDTTADTWVYDEKIIYILYDEGHNTYCNASATSGVCLKVIRSSDNTIKKLVETNSQELESFVK